MTAETWHWCSYECDRPECIRAQRDELAARLTTPPSAPVGVEGLARLLERIRDLLASLPVDCLGSGTDASGQPYPIRDEVIHGITKALAQQPAAVDEGMVERATTAYLQSRGTYEGEVPVDRDDIRAALTAALAQQPAAAGEESSKGADVARPKRRPYNASGSLSEYGVFPECDAQQPAAGTVDKVRFRKAPCYLCGYNGPGYYQPDTHPCAAKYHATQHQEPKP